MKRFLFLLLPVLIITGCKNKDKFTIEGNWPGKNQKYIYINRIDVDTPIRIDSAKIDKKGSFRMKIKAVEPDYFQLGFSTANFITLLVDPGENIKVTFKGENLFDNYTIIGSKGSLQVQLLDLRLSETKKKLDSLKVVYDAVKNDPDFKEKGPLLEAEFINAIKDQRKKNIEFIIANLGSLASINALYQRINENTYVLYEPNDLQYLKLVSDSLKRYYPNSKHTKALIKNVENEMSEMYRRRIEQMAKEVPETKLDPNLKDMTGKKIALSSIKNKYVLLTFWSVSSKECITENLQLKELYRLYNKKGFEIYQIDLDENEENWKAAVKYDELPWISVREDDPLTSKNVLLYNVKSLPTNYLYDKNGSIIASNLHGKTLQIKLDQLFNN
jgi:thiol-disulfide isomerase/thioredoxin